MAGFTPIQQVANPNTASVAVAMLNALSNRPDPIDNFRKIFADSVSNMQQISWENGLNDARAAYQNRLATGMTPEQALEGIDPRYAGSKAFIDDALALQQNQREWNEEGRKDVRLDLDVQRNERDWIVNRIQRAQEGRTAADWESTNLANAYLGSLADFIARNGTDAAPVWFASNRAGLEQLRQTYPKAYSAVMAKTEAGKNAPVTPRDVVLSAKGVSQYLDNYAAKTLAKPVLDSEGNPVTDNNGDPLVEVRGVDYYNTTKQNFDNLLSNIGAKESDFTKPLTDDDIMSEIREVVKMQGLEGDEDAQDLVENYWTGFKRVEAVAKELNLPRAAALAAVRRYLGAHGPNFIGFGQSRVDFSGAIRFLRENADLWRAAQKAIPKYQQAEALMTGAGAGLAVRENAKIDLQKKIESAYIQYQNGELSYGEVQDMISRDLANREATLRDVRRASDFMTDAYEEMGSLYTKQREKKDKAIDKGLQDINALVQTVQASGGE